MLWCWCCCEESHTWVRSVGGVRPPLIDILLMIVSFLCDANDTKILNYTRGKTKLLLYYFINVVVVVVCRPVDEDDDETRLPVVAIVVVAIVIVRRSTRATPRRRSRPRR